MSSNDVYLSWLESAQSKNPKYASELSQLGDYYKQKLWHQLTTLIEELLPQKDFQSFLISFYDNFIIAFAHRINLLKLAQIAEVTAKQYKQPEQAIQFLQGVNKQITESGQRHTEQPMLFLRMHIAEYKLQTGATDECKTLIEEGKETLDSMQNVRLPVTQSAADSPRNSFCLSLCVWLPTGRSSCQCYCPLHQEPVLQVQEELCRVLQELTFVFSLHLIRQTASTATAGNLALVHRQITVSHQTSGSCNSSCLLHCNYMQRRCPCFMSTLLILPAFGNSNKHACSAKCHILQALAVDISLAALLGENIYNFGELLQHPIVSTLTCFLRSQHTPSQGTLMLGCTNLDHGHEWMCMSLWCAAANIHIHQSSTLLCCMPICFYAKLLLWSTCAPVMVGVHRQSVCCPDAD